MLEIILFVFIGLALLQLAFKLAKYIPALALLGLICWLAYEHTEAFFQYGSFVVGILCFVAWINDRSLYKKVEKHWKSSDAAGFASAFVVQSSPAKEKIVKKFLQPNSSGDKSRLVEQIFIRDFFDYARKSGNGDTILFEKKQFDAYLNKVWRKNDLKRLNFDWIASNASRMQPGWHVSKENPVDHKSGKRVDLIRVSKTQSVFEKVAFNLDE
jgi:hypothetical protein